MSGSKLFIGTAGWSIHARYAGQFGGGGTHLERYGRRMNCAEIDTSFYRPHKRDTYAKWAASVPEEFRFAVKLQKTITHGRRLAECETPLDEFLVGVDGLGAKLGVLLAQLPPSLAFDGGRLEDFVRSFQDRSSVPLAVEPRHRSWFTGEADALLARLGTARVAADPARAEGAERPGVATELAYFRWHGSPKLYYSDYPRERLAAFEQQVEAAGDAPQIWCIFDNTAEFHALGNALSLKKMIEHPEG